MISEAIQRIEAMAKQATAAREPDVQTVPQEPKDVYFVTDAEGRFERHVAEPAPRNYSANSVVDACSMALHFQEEKEITLFCSRNGVFGIMEEKSARRDRIRCELALSSPMKTLLHLEANDIQADQRQFLNMLRVQLGVDAQSTPTNLVARVRALKFTNSGSGISVIANSGDSFGKSVQAQTLGMDGQEFPDTVIIAVEPIEGVEFSWGVTCAFDIDSVSQKFRLKPIAGECEKAIKKAEGYLLTYVNNCCFSGPEDKVRIKVLGGSVS